MEKDKYFPGPMEFLLVPILSFCIFDEAKYHKISFPNYCYLTAAPELISSDEVIFQFLFFFFLLFSIFFPMNHFHPFVLILVFSFRLTYTFLDVLNFMYLSSAMQG